uniref:Uncharacterized protein n=1 Tax=Anguilla anguilla TaxID=7936 RepID=A0A0E9TLE0_ANGAN
MTTLIYHCLKKAIFHPKILYTTCEMK